MLHTIKSWFNFSVKNSHTHHKLTGTNFTFTLLKILNYLISLFLTRFFRQIDVLQRRLTKLQYLPIRVLPPVFKQMFILSNLRNNRANGLNVLRLKKYKLIHNFWVLVNGQMKPHYIYNLKNITNNKTKNFYFAMKQVTKTNKNFLQFYYFFDKIVFSRGSYLYWVDNVLYYNQQIFKDPNKIYNMRIFLFFMYINVLKSYDKNISFFRANLRQFSGLNNFFSNIDKFYLNSLPKKTTAITKKLQPKSKIKRETVELTTHRSVLNAYYNFYKDEITANTTLLLNYILINNANFNKKTTQISNSNISNKFKMLALTWYNKVHNTTYNVSKNIVVMYLRAARHFNKGRYSRNRQLYRTGVYWCIWLNVVIVYALHYYFYRVVFAFGYLWLPLCVMMLSIFSSRIYKYRYYSINQLIQEFKEYNNFLFCICLRFKTGLQTFLLNAQELLKVLYKSLKNVVRVFIQGWITFFKSLLQ